MQKLTAIEGDSGVTALGSASVKVAGSSGTVWPSVKIRWRERI